MLYTIVMTDLNSYEAFHRKQVKKLKRPVTFYEVLLSYLLILVVSPFLTATFLLIPFLGQILVIGAVLLVIAYIYARRSFLLALTAIFAYFSFLIPMFGTIQHLKYKLEVVLFFLMAGGVPITMVFMLLVAGMLWWEKERTVSYE